MEQTDAQLVLSCQRGALDDFALLYDRYIKDIYRFVYFKTHHKETAEDLTSQSFIKALEHISSFNGEMGSFKSWLYRIARNTVIDHYRARKATVDIEDAWDVASDDDVERDAIAREQLGKVKQYLKDLDAEQRDIVVMRLWEDMPYKEIAMVLGKSEASCKMSFSRTMAKVRKEVLIALLLLLII